MSSEREVGFSFGTWMGLVVILIVFTGDNSASKENTKLKEYCARVAVYEQTKDTNDVRGHRDFDDDMECSDVNP